MKTSNRNLYIGILLILMPALLINLGLVAFINDEAIRALVALEMDLSKNYITPTMFGDYYYNKPPLYNWILLVFSKIYGQSNEFISRLPTVFFLLIYAATVYSFSKQYFNKKTAFINAFMLITCGRILFYDSFLGLIDICFSWLIYLMFMVIYHKWKAGKFYQLFTIAYTLAALAFLMKGLPAIVFLGSSLLAHFIYQRQFSRLFSLAHFCGIAILIGLIGSYYWAYHQYNDLKIVFDTLINESAKRTPIEYNISETVLHFFSFPFEMIFHFLPWSLLVIYLFQKNIKEKLLQNPFIAYNVLIFIATIPLYWISVEVYPRYLFMHVPLFFTTLIYLHTEQETSPKWQYKLIFRVFGIAIYLAPLVFLVLPPLINEVEEIPYFYLKMSGVFLLLTIGIWLYLKKEKDFFLVFIFVLLVARIGFNWFILPSREKVERTTVCRTSAIRIAEKFQDKDLYIYKGNLGWNPGTAYYITNTRQSILTNRYEDFDKNAVYIINHNFNQKLKYTTLDTLEVHYRNDQLLIVQLVE